MSQIISQRTCKEFREFLVGWTLREIGDEFEVAGIKPDLSYRPPVGGQRRSYVEQHYHALDLNQASDVRRLLEAFENILIEAGRRVQAGADGPDAKRAVERLVASLERDGLDFDGQRITAASPRVRKALEGEPAQLTISEVTRRNILGHLRGGAWSGRLSEEEFLDDVFDLDAIPSEDGRFRSLRQELWQHRVNNPSDWPGDWVFTDARLGLLSCPDACFLSFLCRMVHPVVRPDDDEVQRLVELVNGHLAADGWELVATSEVSRRPVFSPQRREGARVSMAGTTASEKVLSDEYVREIAAKCDARLVAGDFDGAITTGRTLLEAVLAELETRLAGKRGDHKGDLTRQFKAVAKLVRMDEERPDLDDRFKDVIRGLVMVASGLAPLRNKMSDGHARVRRPAAHHARVVVNAAKTVASFLVESYLYQQERGLLGGSGDSA